jgi:enoyl-CoA hydratase
MLDETDRAIISYLQYDGRMPYTKIASVRGHCLAAGFEVALACDLTIAAEGSSFGEPELRFGDGPVTLLMPWVISMKKTRELLYTSGSVSAEEAERLGIINRVVPADKLEEETQALSLKLSLVPPEVMRLTKKPINRTYEIMGLFEALKTNIDYRRTRLEARPNVA